MSRAAVSSNPGSLFESELRRRTDLPSARATRIDILLAERAYGAANVLWDPAGRWIMIRSWSFPRGEARYNLAAIPVLIMVPDGYGLRSGQGSGLEEFYIHPDLRMWTQGGWRELPHTYANLDRRSGQAIARRWVYCCAHISWNPRRDNILHAMNQLALYLSNPEKFARLADRNGGHHD